MQWPVNIPTLVKLLPRSNCRLSAMRSGKLKGVFISYFKGFGFLAGSFANWSIGSAVYCVTAEKHTTAGGACFFPSQYFLSFVFTAQEAKCSISNLPPFPWLNSCEYVNDFRICPVALIPKESLHNPSLLIRYSFYVVRWTLILLHLHSYNG